MPDDEEEAKIIDKIMKNMMKGAQAKVEGRPSNFAVLGVYYLEKIDGSSNPMIRAGSLKRMAFT